MEDIILKLQELKTLKPEKKWTGMVKSRIMGRERWLMPFDFNFDWISNRTVWTAAASFAIFLLAVFGYNQLYFYSQLALQTKSLETLSQGLKAVESNIVKTRDGLGNISQPEQAVGVKDIVNSAIENGQKLITGTKKIADNPGLMRIFPDVFSTLSNMGEAADGVGSALQDMEETYLTKQKDLAKGLIEELSQNDLTVEQKTALEEAKSLYNEGKFDQALEKVLNITK